MNIFETKGINDQTYQILEFLFYLEGTEKLIWRIENEIYFCVSLCTTEGFLFVELVDEFLKFYSTNTLLAHIYEVLTFFQAQYFELYVCMHSKFRGMSFVFILWVRRLKGHSVTQGHKADELEKWY